MKGLACVLLLAGLLGAQEGPRLRVWRAGASGVGEDGALVVGSLQKPFVAQAWAASHPGRPSPRHECRGGDCWRPGGHGELGLVRALALSCNAYFLRLARETPRPALQAALQEAGFQGPPLDPEAAIGLPSERPPVIRPSRLLEAYARLVREPWSRGEEIRREILAGLRMAGRDGTAAGLDQPGLWAKTGTVPEGPGRTRGLVLMLDDEGRATLAELRPGTGREAALALGRSLRQGPAGEGGSARGSLLVQLFDLLPSRRWKVRNLGASPLPTEKGFLGPGAVRELRPGAWVGPGLLEIEVGQSGLLRRLEGRLVADRDGQGRARLLASLTPREYVGGVLQAELPEGTLEQRWILGATVLRFLARGPRHATFDVCDSTHCAWFVGRGPRLRWETPRRAIRTGPTDAFADPPGDAEWKAMQELAQTPGPSLWSSDCGGAPLSPHALWGNGDRRVAPCPRHNSQPRTPWRRHWTSRDLAKAFGEPVLELALEHPDGVWTLKVRGATRSRDYSFDEAHRLLARVLGWEALPSPADTLRPDSDGFTAEGVGSGHRVGLCLGE